MKILDQSEIRSLDNIRWCDFNGRSASLATQKQLDVLKDVESGILKPSIEEIMFRDTEYFIAGEIHNNLDVWNSILEDFAKDGEILIYFSGGVSVSDFFEHFKGEKKRKSYDSDLPPETIFPNNKICKQFNNFISSSLLEKVCNGSISVRGKESQCKPPHLVMPLTVEPSKPRLCQDERFLNLWMRAPKVSFDNYGFATLR